MCPLTCRVDNFIQGQRPKLAKGPGTKSEATGPGVVLVCVVTTTAPSQYTNIILTCRRPGRLKPPQRHKTPTIAEWDWESPHPPGRVHILAFGRGGGHPVPFACLWLSPKSVLTIFARHPDNPRTDSDHVRILRRHGILRWVLKRKLTKKMQPSPLLLRLSVEIPYSSCSPACLSCPLRPSRPQCERAQAYSISSRASARGSSSSRTRRSSACRRSG